MSLRTNEPTECSLTAAEKSVASVSVMGAAMLQDNLQKKSNIQQLDKIAII